jgi:aminopeptidase N
MGFVRAHDPHERLDYTVDWDDWLSSTESITASSWRSDSTSLAVLSTGVHVSSISSGGRTATVWVAGGVPGETVTVTDRITTDQARTGERSVVLRIENR